jgi:hypothetical protein
MRCGNSGDGAMRTAIPLSLNRRSTELVVRPTDQHEVHAVVVDMPQRASLEHASPETWDTLPGGYLNQDATKCMASYLFRGPSQSDGGGEEPASPPRAPTQSAPQ